MGSGRPGATLEEAEAWGYTKPPRQLTGWSGLRNVRHDGLSWEEGRGAPVDGAALNHSAEFLFLMVSDENPRQGAQSQGRAPDAQQPPDHTRPTHPGPADCWPGINHQLDTASQGSKEGRPNHGQGPAHRCPRAQDASDPWAVPTGSHCTLGGGPDGQGVSLSVEHIGVQAEQVRVV